jgi:hypothetical protein
MELAAEQAKAANGEQVREMVAQAIAEYIKGTQSKPGM